MTYHIALQLPPSQNPNLEPSVQELSRDWSDQDSHGFWSAESLLESLALPHTKIWSIQADGHIEWLGIAVIRIAPDSAEVIYIHTLSYERGKGLAKILLDRVFADLTSQFFVSKIFLEVRPSNQAAIKLYQGLGFKELSRRKRYYQNGEDALILEKNLS